MAKYIGDKLETSFDITKLYNATFGYRGLPFPYGGFEQLNPIGDLEQLSGALKYNTKTGQPLFMAMILGGYDMPNEPTIEVSVSKHIVQTPLAGFESQGTVKELISTEDYKIKIRGVVFSEDYKKYPIDEVSALRQLFEKNEALSVENTLLNLLGVDQLILKNFKLPEMVGVQHAQAYEFTAVSDGDILLTLED